MYNRVILVGRISTDLELRQTSNGKSYCRFNLAVNRMNEGTDFITCRVWNKQAENLVKFQNKGSLVLIDGSIAVSNYDDKDGNKRTSFEVMAQNVQFLGNKKNNTIDEVSNEEVDPYSVFGDLIEEKSSDDINIDGIELPFE